MQHAMKFTGERPGRGAHFDYDEARHLAAYAFAARMAADRHVLDAGCGEGFGTRTLCTVANQVVGLDASAGAIAACRAGPSQPNLHFEVGDLTQPVSSPETFDLVLNFQVLEHIDDALPFLGNLRARLRPGGTLMLTTPNRLMSFSENPFHVREYTSLELAQLLSQVFSSVGIMGMHGSDKAAAFDRQRQRAVQRILRLDPWRLRDRLPRAVVAFAFARLAVLVRQQAQRATGGRIVPEDFLVSGDTEHALDLVAICQA